MRKNINQFLLTTTIGSIMLCATAVAAPPDPFQGFASVASNIGNPVDGKANSGLCNALSTLAAKVCNGGEGLDKMIGVYWSEAYYACDDFGVNLSLTDDPELIPCVDIF